jgi:ABC-type phosphate transport system auxiliary subunit
MGSPKMIELPSMTEDEELLEDLENGCRVCGEDDFGGELYDVESASEVMYDAAQRLRAILVAYDELKKTYIREANTAVELVKEAYEARVDEQTKEIERLRFENADLRENLVDETVDRLTLERDEQAKEIGDLKQRLRDVEYWVNQANAYNKARGTGFSEDG